MTMTLDRQGFEFWVRRHFKYPNLEIDARYPGFYADKMTAGAWEAWKESRARLSQPQPVAQGEAVALAEAERVAHHAYVAGKRGYSFTGFVDELRSSATPTIPTGHRVVPVELGGGLHAEDPIEADWRPLLEWAMGSIDELNEGPMTYDQWGEDAGLYDQARSLLAAAPDAGGV